MYFLYFSKKNIDFLIQLGYSDNRKGITGNGCPCVGKNKPQPGRRAVYFFAIL